MAIATITLLDTNTADASVEARFDVDGERFEEGSRIQYTSAHLVAFYLFRQFQDGALKDRMDAYAEAEGVTIHEATAKDASTIVLTFNDTDTDAGYFSVGVKRTRGDGAMNWTASLLAAHTMHNLVQTPSFMAEMWAFAAQTVEKNPGSRISNIRNCPPLA